tara:strand:+ start:181 stop:420 length:240 start_codon:yes stop_codon:yes gene_type:complete
MDNQKEILKLLNQIADDNKKNKEQHNIEHEYLRVLIEEHKAEKELKQLLKEKIITGSFRALILASLLFFGYSVRDLILA